ncbi:MAG TPA: ribulose-phosphate 3-epimerase [Chitinispirillaceae bacterium]|nr:ribulose-phosphate 3-epimerase [Chitinispirillaceae bacterium]
MKSKRIEIAPSILSADFRNLEREVKAAQDAGADRIHCDIMDGVFVPNITFGPLVVEAVKKCVSIPLDVHLMIIKPEKYYNEFIDAGADVLTFHAEAGSDCGLLLENIRKRGVKSGVTVNPDKPIDLFLPFMEKIDQILIMTVYAGYGGQKFIDETLAKIEAAAKAIDQQEHTVDLQVDGGINEETAFICARRGVNVFVAGSYIFEADDYRKKVAALRMSAESGFRDA